MFKVTFKVGKLADIPRAQDRLKNRLSFVLQEVGTYILQEQKFSFEDKSRGGGGADGKRWKPLAKSTEIAKASRKASFRNARKNVKKISKQLGGSLNAKKRQGLVSRLDKARKASAVPKSQIGVDKGMLRNSARPGYDAPDGLGGNIFIVAGNRVRIGYGRSYAKHFDSVRPLLPTWDQMPRAWRQGVDAIAQEWVDGIAKSLGLQR